MPDYPSNDHSAPNASRENAFLLIPGISSFSSFSFFLSLFFSFCLGFVSDIGERYLMVKTDRFDFDFLFFLSFFLVLILFTF